MKNLWNNEEAKNYTSDLALRVYTSNLLGQSDELVLHGGGNTSVKTKVDGEDILYVKGSGWDLVSIKEEGFAPVKLDVLLNMANLSKLSDSDMVSGQKEAMIDKSAPNPSVEAILHALIPYKFVDHTHADAVVTISNSKTGLENIKQVFPNFLIIPYVMPGFILAQTIYNMTREFNWDKCEGIILHNHGIFTFDNDAKTSYDKMIDAVTKAENFLDENAKVTLHDIKSKEFDCSIFDSKFLNINKTPLAQHYSSQDNIKEFATRGILTPEHIIRTKREPIVIDKNIDIDEAMNEYAHNYKDYFNKFSTNEICLEPKPKYAVIENFGIVSFGNSQKEADIINDIIEHTMLAVLRADKLGGYQSISLQDSFDMEYWELEQAKLKKA